jgi:hypothetical protein
MASEFLGLFKEVEEFKEFKKRSQEPEPRSQEVKSGMSQTGGALHSALQLGRVPPPQVGLGLAFGETATPWGSARRSITNALKT